MICPNCKTNIPGDSRFCPDCGSPVVNIEELRAKAKDIVLNYKEGYEFYVKTGILPCKCYDSSAEICEKIIAMSAAIIERHKQIKEEERIRETASSITIQYAKAYDYYVSIGVLPRFVHNLDIAKCQQIIAKKSDIIVTHYAILEQERCAEEKRKSEQSTLFVLNELNRLGITDSDKRAIFLEHPDRLKREHWIKWAREKKDNINEPERFDYYGKLFTPFIVALWIFFSLICLLMMIPPTNRILMPILDYLDKM